MSTRDNVEVEGKGAEDFARVVEFEFEEMHFLFISCSIMVVNWAHRFSSRGETIESSGIF